MMDVEDAGDARDDREDDEGPEQDPIRIDAEVLDALFVRPDGAELDLVRQCEHARDEQPDEDQREHGEDEDVGAPGHCGQRAEVSGREGQEEAVRAASAVARVLSEKTVVLRRGIYFAMISLAHGFSQRVQLITLLAADCRERTRLHVTDLIFPLIKYLECDAIEPTHCQHYYIYWSMGSLTDYRQVPGHRASVDRPS